MHQWIKGGVRDLPFDVIALTAPNERAASAYFSELCDAVVELLGGTHVVTAQQQPTVQPTLCVCVADPRGARVGSGGGTINALWEINNAVAAESDASLRSSFAEDCRILLIHSGGDSQRSPTQCVCGKAWVALNSSSSSLALSPKAPETDEQKRRCWCTPMTLLLKALCRLIEGGLQQGAIVIACCDVLLLIPRMKPPVTWDWSGGVVGLAIATNESYASAHGVYAMDFSQTQQGIGETPAVRSVVAYMQKPAIQEVEAKDGFIPSSRTVAIDTGVVVFLGRAANVLRRIAIAPTFGGCTAIGVLAGVPPLRLELYSDIIFAIPTSKVDICSKADESQTSSSPPSLSSSSLSSSSASSTSFFASYLASCGPPLQPDDPMYIARKEIFDAFNCTEEAASPSLKMGCLLLGEKADFAHLGTTRELMALLTLQMPAFNGPFNLHHMVGVKIKGEPPPSITVADGATVVNSELAGSGSIGEGAVVEHCCLTGEGWSVGDRSFASGVRRSYTESSPLVLGSGMALQEVSLGDSFILSLYAVNDGIKLHYEHSDARVCGVPWAVLLGCSGVSVDDIWPSNLADAQRTLWHAKLFPILSHPNDTASLMWMQRLRRLSNSKGSSEDDKEKAGELLCQSDDDNAAAAIREPARLWAARERLSFCDVLALADPQAEFSWRKELSRRIAAAPP